MWANPVVFLDVSVDPPFCTRYRVVSPQEDLIVLQRAPETLDETVVCPSLIPIHPDVAITATVMRHVKLTP